MLPNIDTACKCCKKNLIDGGVISLYDKITIAVWEYTGEKITIKINSGYRCPKYNAKIGGAKNSQHVQGRALDLANPLDSYEDFYAICDRIVGDLGGVGKYPKNNFVHIDCRGERSRWNG